MSNPRETFLAINDIVLYTAQDNTITEGYHIKNYLANNNIEFQHLHYADLNQTHQVISAINTWIDPLDEEPDLTEFPFLVVREDWEAEEVNVKFDENGRPDTKIDDNGNVVVLYEVQKQTIEKIYVARNVKQVDEKDLINKLKQG